MAALDAGLAARDCGAEPNRKDRAVEAILTLLLFIIAIAALNLYEFGRLD